MQVLSEVEKQGLEHYKSVKQRVFFVYAKCQEAVDCNKRLLFYYKQVFGEADLCEESVTRAGRFWRDSRRELEHMRCFKRSDDVLYRDDKLLGLNKWIWGMDK